MSLRMMMMMLMMSNYESESEYFAAESHSQKSAASAEAYGRILHGGLDLEAIPENCLLTGHHIRETVNKG